MVDLCPGGYHTVMVRRTRDGQTFGDIYREQYRQTSSTWSARVLRAVSPFLLLFAVLNHRRGAAVMIAIGAVGIVMIGAAVVLSRRHPSGGPSAGRVPLD